MIVFISPAKGFHDECGMYKDLPVFIDHSTKIVEKLKEYNVEDLGKLFKVSDELAALNVERFKEFTFYEELKPALFAYSGMQYNAMNLKELKEDEIDFLQDHLRILSGLYGVLQPMDGIRPYRLEMLTKVSIDECKNLYEYWNDCLYQALSKDNDVIVNLASNEYSKCIEPYIQDETYVSIVFKVDKNGKQKVMSTASKKARGAMVSYIARNKIDDYTLLKEFKEDGYVFDETQSIQEGNKVVYTFVKYM